MNELVQHFGFVGGKLMFGATVDHYDPDGRAVMQRTIMEITHATPQKCDEWIHQNAPLFESAVVKPAGEPLPYKTRILILNMLDHEGRKHHLVAYPNQQSVVQTPLSVTRQPEEILAID